MNKEFKFIQFSVKCKYIQHVIKAEELMQEKRLTVDEGPVAGAGWVAGTARGRSDDANGDQLTGLEVGDRVVRHWAGHLRRDCRPVCMRTKEVCFNASGNVSVSENSRTNCWYSRRRCRWRCPHHWARPSWRTESASRAHYARCSRAHSSWPLGRERWRLQWKECVGTRWVWQTRVKCPILA